jgi:hypothetical protein
LQHCKPADPAPNTPSGPGSTTTTPGGSTTATTSTVPLISTSVAPTTSGISSASARVSAVIDGNGGAAISQHGFVYSKTAQIPTLNDSKTELGATSGPFPLTISSNLTGLDANSTYYVRAYATNPTGTGYGAVAQVKTTSEVVSTGTITVKAKFPGTARGNARIFTLNEKLYVMGGEFGSSANRKDLWEYDPSQDKWVQKADAPVDQALGSYWYRIFGGGAPVMLIGSRIYVVASAKYLDGTNKSVVLEFDPGTNKWATKGQVPAYAERASAFVLGNKGYLLMQGETTARMVYQYDAGTDKWLKKKDFPGECRYAGVTAAYGGKGYLIAGLNKDRNFVTDMWEYDESKDEWTKLASDFPSREAIYEDNTFLTDNILTIGSYYYNYTLDFSAKSWKRVALPASITNSPLYGGTCVKPVDTRARGIQGSTYYFFQDLSGSVCKNLMGELWQFKP